MNESPNTIDNLNENLVWVAQHYLRLGYRPIPVVRGTKQAAVKWKPYQARPPTEHEVDLAFSAGEPNIALVTGGGLVVVDIDDSDRALLDAVVEHCGDTPMKCQTPSGGLHLYYGTRKGVHYGNKVRIKGKPLDLRCEGAYAMCPWSRNAEGKSYEWLGDVLPVVELPLLRVSWLREKSPARSPKLSIEATIGDGIMVRRAAAWLACVEGARSGNRGHSATFRAACKLVHPPPRGFGLLLEQAFPIIWNWNVHACEPPWSEKEILHKLEDAMKKR